jgi:GTP-binding protein
MAEFVDTAQLHVKAGDGGAGSVSFRREAHVERGGPDGGDGGSGGDVWVVADRNQASLLGFRDHPFRRADSGQHGKGKKRHGSRGQPIEVPVPVGTVIMDLDGTEVCDLRTEGDRWLAAEGGKGGMGNARFLSNRRRAPSFAEQGMRGEEAWYNLELKLVADVALVGFPNVGKSTLIASVSAAKPKIADYPFTTLIPNLGVVRVGGGGSRTEFVMADIPGLIEGAAEGKGLGHQFLRHIERARVLCVLLDLSPSAPVEPAAQLAVLLDELGRYQPDLLERPRLTIGSKADLAEARPGEGLVDLVVSSITREGLDILVGRLGALVSQVRSAEADVERHEITIHRPAEDMVRIERLDDGGFLVVGRAAERAVRFSDLEDDGALDEAIRRLEKLGIDKMLSRAGIREGDRVVVGDLEFTWWRHQDAKGLDPDELPRRRRAAKEAP